MALALGTALVPGAIGLDRDLGPAAAVTILAIGLWATGAIAEYVTALLLFALVTVFGIARPEVIFAGFTGSAFWLIFGGLVLGAAVRKTGLGDRFGRIASRFLTGSYLRVITGITLFGAMLALLVPAAFGRIVILIPLTVALADALGFRPGSNGRIGMVMAASLGTILPAFAVMPANLPNLVLIGAAETLYGISTTYGRYMLLSLPVISIPKILLIIGLVVRLFPDTPKPAGTGETAGEWTAPEVRLLAVLVLALALWATDSIHHVSPAWVALLGAVVCLLPGLGLLRPAEFSREIDFGSAIYVAGVLGVVSLIAASGLGTWLGETLVGIMPLAPHEAFRSFATITGIAAVVGVLTTMPGVPAVLTPLAASIAEVTQLPLETVVMAQLFAISAPLFPYQLAPLAIGLSMGGVRLQDAFRVTAAAAGLSFLLLTPLGFAWWWLLGMFPG